MAQFLKIRYDKGMTLQQLKYAVTVAETKNITEASRKVFISQPSLTASIHELESEMGITIFSRTNKGVTITNEGDELDPRNYRRCFQAKKRSGASLYEQQKSKGNRNAS